MPDGNRLHFVQEPCELDLVLFGKYILADDNNGCGGMKVRFSGVWKRTILRQFSTQSVSSEAAHQMIAAAERKAVEIGRPMVIAIVDELGVLTALLRMHGAALRSVQVARDKGYTAAGFGWRPNSGTTSSRTIRRWRPAATASIGQLVIFGGGYTPQDWRSIHRWRRERRHDAQDMEVAAARLTALGA